MGGIGSFNRDNHTLYVGGVRMVPNVEDVVRKHFGKFGEIIDLRILHGRSIAFITYKLRVAAEFAKEAMSDQSIIGNEVLNVRWANEDPNPQVQHQKQDKLRAEAWDQMQQTHPDFFKQYELLSQEQYPNTDHQYPSFVPPENEGGVNSARPNLEDGPAWAPKLESKQSDDSDDSASDEPSDNPSDVTTDKKHAENQADNVTAELEEIPKTAEELEYEAWQTWYAQRGYPGYYDHNGKYHYYDPKHFDPNKPINSVAQEEGNYDYYQYYASYPVENGREKNAENGPSDFLSHFSSYARETEEDLADGEAPPTKPPAHSDLSDAPLY